MSIFEVCTTDKLFSLLLIISMLSMAIGKMMFYNIGINSKLLPPCSKMDAIKDTLAISRLTCLLDQITDWFMSRLSQTSYEQMCPL